jgi:tetratricopeptide (TPR) repeat protein
VERDAQQRGRCSVIADGRQDLLQRLCLDLRLLWRQAGGPSLRQLGARVRLSKSQVGAILTGDIRRPPQWDVIRGLLEGIDQYAYVHGRMRNLSIRTGVDEYWRPRYAVMEHAFLHDPRTDGSTDGSRIVPAAHHSGHADAFTDQTHPRAAGLGVSAGNAAQGRGLEKERIERPLPDPGGDFAGLGRVVPRQLPLAVPHLAGRTAELDTLTRLADQSAGANTTVVISAISGTAGVGKTALAISWAHHVASRFPDGQLYVNLRGFDPSGSVMGTAEAVRGFLDALGTAPERIPPNLEAQVGLYRSLLADRRILVVLDNARDVEQVRPLLPGSPGCLVLVTSRNQLAGLVAAQGAHPLSLDVLSVAEALEFLAGRLGADRTAAEPEAVEELVARCARLPLALAIVAARCATYPAFPLAVLAAKLRDTSIGLDAFAGEDAATDMRAVLSWSYHTLSADAGRLFRLLGLHPGPDVAMAAAASLAEVPVGRVRPALDELTRAHLIAEHSPGRYTFHDLLRAYATELAHTHDADDERRTATRRLLDHYLHTAYAAHQLFDAPLPAMTLTPAGTTVRPEQLDDRRQALTWFATEHTVLLRAVEHSVNAGLDTHAYQLALSLDGYLSQAGRWNDQTAVMSVALDAARRQADRGAQARAHHSLTIANALCGRFDAAHTHRQQAFELFTAIGDHRGQGRACLNLSYLLDLQGRHREALNHARQALDLHRATGDRAGQGNALNNIGVLHARLGNHTQALSFCEQALALHQGGGSGRRLAETWDSLGGAHLQLGHHQRAITCYQNALNMSQEIGNRYGEALVLAGLGNAYQAAGDAKAACSARQHALRILDQLDNPDTKQIRAKLGHLDHAEADPAHTAGTSSKTPTAL